MTSWGSTIWGSTRASSFVPITSWPPTGDGPGEPVLPGRHGRVRERIEEQLGLLTERQAAVEARLQQIRAVIIRPLPGCGGSGPDQPA